MNLEINKLNEFQRAIYEAIARFDKPPITKDNLITETKNSQTFLMFNYETSKADEFNVYLFVNDEECEIYADGWHMHVPFEKYPYNNAIKILEQLMTMFDGRIKLKVTYAGANPYKWETLHNWAEGKWESLGVVQLLFFNYFGRRRTIEKINHIIEFKGYFYPDK